MGGVVLTARVLLAAVFGVAGAAKVVDRAGSRRAAAGFGVPEPLAPLVAVGLPLAELAVAATLLPRATAVGAGIAAAALLVVFAAAIVWNVARGRRPDCHCFGQLHSSPAGWTTAARNAALAAMAAFVAAGGPGRSLVAPIEAVGAGALGGLVGAAFALWVSYRVLRQNGRLLLRIDALEAALAEHGIEVAESEPVVVEQPGVPVGEPAPVFVLERADGGSSSLADLLAPGLPAMLVFTDAACGPCRALLPELAEWQREHAGELVFALVASGDAATNREEGTANGLAHILLDSSERQMQEAYHVNATPSAVLVAADGTVASGVAPGAASIRALVERALARSPWTGPAVGTAVDLTLPDASGRATAIDTFRGRRVLLVNWSPSCGFCDAIAPELAQLAPRLRAQGTELVLASWGGAKDNVEHLRRHGIEAQLLLQNGTVVEPFRDLGTPVALLLDEEGRVASSLSVGANEVPQLARRLAAN